MKNRVHLDLVADDFDLEGARLLSLGAVRLHNFASPDADTRHGPHPALSMPAVRKYAEAHTGGAAGA